MNSLATRGDITTILDLTARDAQDDLLYPLTADTTLFTRDRQEIKPLLTTPAIQEIGPRGPTAFGQRCVFDLNPSQLPDMIHGVSLQIALDHWLSTTVRARIADGTYSFPVDGTIWEYANALGISIIEEATFEVGDTTLEKLTGEFITTWLTATQLPAKQVAVAADAVGAVPVCRLSGKDTAVFPVEDGLLTCVLPFFFNRGEPVSAFPLVSCKDSSVRISIKLRPFEQVVRQIRGYRDSCTSTPLGITQLIFPVGPVKTADSPPEFRQCSLTVRGIYLDLSQRSKYVKQPHEVIYKHLYMNTFTEPLRYASASTGTRYNDTIKFLLPLEFNGPISTIWWVLRRKAASLNNDWTTFGPALQFDYQQYGATIPHQFEDPVVEGRILLNGLEAVKKSGYEFRNTQPASTIISADNWIYSYSWAGPCGTGHFNASRLQSVQLALTVRNTLPLPVELPSVNEEMNGWEVYVFAESTNWLRFENGMVGRIFQ